VHVRSALKLFNFLERWTPPIQVDYALMNNKFLEYFSNLWCGLKLSKYCHSSNIFETGTGPSRAATDIGCTSCRASLRGRLTLTF
jgi:hypothetical protein